MFTELHAMAKAAMLLITATAEGDQLRISISPTYPDGKAPAGAVALRPLALVGTPDELNADFSAALVLWQTPPKRSIIEQAQAAAAQEADDTAPEKAVAKAASKEVEPKPKRSPARKAAPAAEAAGKPDAKSINEGEADVEDDAVSTGAPEVDAAPAVVDGTAAAPAAPAPVVDVVDAQTLDLF